MEQHSPKEVATTIKTFMRVNRISVEDFAKDNKVSANEIYNILNGKEYMSINWALRFTNLGFSHLYCWHGYLPMYDFKFDMQILRSSIEDYREAVDNEDYARDTIKRLSNESPNLEEIAEWEKALVQLTQYRKELGEDLDREMKEYEKYEKFRGRFESNVDSKIQRSELKLHEAIKQVIDDAGHPLMYSQIAEEINRTRLYVRNDGADVPSSQISARVKCYKEWFSEERSESGRVLINNKKQQN